MPVDIRINVVQFRKPRRRFGFWFEDGLPAVVGMESPEWTVSRPSGPKPVEDKKFLDSVPGLMRVVATGFAADGACLTT
jgi:hypothetical protein